MSHVGLTRSKDRTLLEIVSLDTAYRPANAVKIVRNAGAEVNKSMATLIAQY